MSAVEFVIPGLFWPKLQLAVVPGGSTETIAVVTSTKTFFDEKKTVDDLKKENFLF
jgi:hypothetical protein